MRTRTALCKPCCREEDDAECILQSNHFADEDELDDFTVESGDWEISGGKLAALSTGGSLIADAASPTDNAKVEVEVTFGGPGSVTLKGAWQNDSNYLFGRLTIREGSSFLKLFSRIDGEDNQIGETQFFTGNINGTYTIELCWTEDSAAFVLLPESEGDFIVGESGGFSPAGGGAGLSASVEGGVLFDDFYLWKHILDDPDCKDCRPVDDDDDANKNKCRAFTDEFAYEDEEIPSLVTTNGWRAGNDNWEFLDEELVYSGDGGGSTSTSPAIALPGQHFSHAVSVTVDVKTSNNAEQGICIFLHDSGDAIITGYKVNLVCSSLCARLEILTVPGPGSSEPCSPHHVFLPNCVGNKFHQLRLCINHWARVVSASVTNDDGEEYWTHCYVPGRPEKEDVAYSTLLLTNDSESGVDYYYDNVRVMDLLDYEEDDYYGELTDNDCPCCRPDGCEGFVEFFNSDSLDLCHWDTGGLSSSLTDGAYVFADSGELLYQGSWSGVNSACEHDHSFRVEAVFSFSDYGQSVTLVLDKKDGNSHFATITCESEEGAEDGTLSVGGSGDGDSITVPHLTIDNTYHAAVCMDGTEISAETGTYSISSNAYPFYGQQAGFGASDAGVAVTFWSVTHNIYSISCPDCAGGTQIGDPECENHPCDDHTFPTSLIGKLRFGGGDEHGGCCDELRRKSGSSFVMHLTAADDPIVLSTEEPFCPTEPGVEIPDVVGQCVGRWQSDGVFIGHVPMVGDCVEGGEPASEENEANWILGPHFLSLWRCWDGKLYLFGRANIRVDVLGHPELSGGSVIDLRSGPLSEEDLTINCLSLSGVLNYVDIPADVLCDFDTFWTLTISPP